jgi:hypothetical protein
MPRREYLFTNMVLGNPRLRYFVEGLQHDAGVTSYELSESERNPFVFRAVVQVGPEGLENKGLERELSPFENVYLPFPVPPPQFFEVSYVTTGWAHPIRPFPSVGTWVTDGGGELFQILRIDPADNFVLVLTEDGERVKRHPDWLRRTMTIPTPGAFKIWRQMGRSKAFLP